MLNIISSWWIPVSHKIHRSFWEFVSKVVWMLWHNTRDLAEVGNLWSERHYFIVFAHICFYILSLPAVNSKWPFVFVLLVNCSWMQLCFRSEPKHFKECLIYPAWYTLYLYGTAIILTENIAENLCWKTASSEELPDRAWRGRCSTQQPATHRHLPAPITGSLCEWTSLFCLCTPSTLWQIIHCYTLSTI